MTAHVLDVVEQPPLYARLELWRGLGVHPREPRVAQLVYTTRVFVSVGEGFPDRLGT